MSSWFSPKTEKRASAIEGRGLFARQAIAAGEIVAVKGGAIMDAAAFARVRDQVSPAQIQIEDGLYIAPRTAEEVEANILCLNHSCRPNVGVRGQITFVTMRDVAPGSELTIDYAMIDGDPKELMECACGAPECRRVITGDDWRLPELQRRYAGHFSRYIEARFMANRVPEFRAPTPVERIFNRAFGFFVGLGFSPRDYYLLQVRGRRSGRVYSTPVNVIELRGRRYLVAPRGRAQWVKNAEAAGEIALKRGSSRVHFTVRPIPTAERGETLSAYLDRFRTTVQRYFPVPAGSGPEAFAGILDRYPVFELREA